MIDTTLVFRPPAERLNMNDRMHWSDKAKLTAAWKTAAWAVANNMRRHPSFVQPEGLVSVRVSFPVRSLKTRRDPHNMAPTVKAVVDGIVTAGVLVDDSSEHVRVIDPTFHLLAADPNVRVNLSWEAP